MKLLAQIEDIARRAGEIILQVYSDQISVEHKLDNSPVTKADMWASDFILKELNILDSKIPVLCEEAVAEFSGANQKRQYWLVDPLDGTKEFIKKTGQFTVNIALIENGKPVLGVVYVPAADILYSAELGCGAYKVLGAKEPVAIQSQSKKDIEKWRVVGSYSHVGDMQDWLKVLGEFELLSIGSSLKFCLVAEGVAHLYPRFTPTSFWDTAAAQIILEESGGKVINLFGESIDYSHWNHYLNPWFIASHKDYDVQGFCDWAIKASE